MGLYRLIGNIQSCRPTTIPIRAISLEMTSSSAIAERPRDESAILRGWCGSLWG